MTTVGDGPGLRNDDLCMALLGLFYEVMVGDASINKMKKLTYGDK